METRIIISQIFILAIVIIIGVVAGKFRVLNNESKDMLSKVIFNISLPIMLFTNFLKLDATRRLVSNSLLVLVISGVILLLMFVAGWITTKILRMEAREAAVFKAHSMFGNTIFLGFPLITALYGEEGLLYASMFQLVSSILTWTAGVVILSHGNGTSLKRSLFKVLNLNTLATLAGFVFFLFMIKLPDLIMRPLEGVGSMNTWLSMLYIGVMLALLDVRGLLGKLSPYVISLNKLLLIPAILISSFALLAAYTGVSFDKMLISVIILEISMPCMAIIVIMAKEFGADDHIAVGNVFVSTIISIATLPVVLLLINRFL